MSQDNQITLRGYLTAEPKFVQTPNMADPVTEIRVGSTPRRLNRATGEWEDTQTSYFTVKCWRRLAINAVGSLHKGDSVVVRGRFYTRQWVDNLQQTQTRLEIEADSLGHDLAYGWSHFLRGTRPQAGSQAGVNAGEAARQDLGPSGPGQGGYPADGGEYPAPGGWDEPATGPAVTDGESGFAARDSEKLVPVSDSTVAADWSEADAAAPF
ncbi:MAG TPA: single-stranded DNA-binding protein [Trebonia sp.]